MRPRLQPTDVLEPEPRLQLADSGDGRLLVRHAGGVSLIEGVKLADAEAVLAEIDGVRSAEEVADALAGRYGTRRAVRLLRRLFGDVVRRRPRPVAGRVLVVGDGAAARRLAELLGGQGLRDVSLADDPPAVRHRLRGADLVIAILECTSYKVIFELQADCLNARVPSLYVTFDADGVRVGPSVVPGTTACFACSQLAHFAFLGQGAAGKAEDLRTLEGRDSEALRAAAAEAREIVAADGEPSYLTRVVRFSAAGRSDLAVDAADACPLGCREIPAPSGRLAWRSAAEFVEAGERRPPAAAPGPDEELVRSVGILGGGTAGYLTALALRRRLPHLAVTLVESSAVPIIGVGEATTPLMPQFLHVDLGLDAHELFREVRPTLKLGIRFLWGPPDGGHFNYPFGRQRTLEAFVHDGHIRDGSLRSMMMTGDRAPVRWRPDEDRRPISGLDTEIAYHLDNARFVRYLREKARQAGVEHVDATVADVEVSGDGREVTALVTDGGRRLAFDLYADCSGFRSLLLGKALGSPFVDFADSLPTDRAWVATVPNGGVARPYTLAETYGAGWCWSTPQAAEDHRGYVFSSTFASPEEALAEMRAKNPGMGEPRLVEFRAGRHAHFCRGNVVALGNAYGFVEPLESTALHMLIRQLGLLLEAFPLRRGGRGLEGLLNRRVNAAWDYLRWFLAVHYKFNTRLDTPFWRAARCDIDVASHGELLEAFAERGPLSYDRTARLAFDYPDPLWGPEGIDTILLGQRVASRLPRPLVGRAAWERWKRRCRAVSEGSLAHHRALELLAERPELLEEFAAAFRAAGPAFAVRRGPRSEGLAETAHLW